MGRHGVLNRIDPNCESPASPADRGNALMLQGTGSDVGKSLLAAGLCRAFANRGLAVRPFKPQNMSNNAAVTEDGGEIGRAQALQARAARVAPSVHMNPVLLKPASEVGAQVVVQGRVWGNADARAYHTLKPDLLPRVLESFDVLCREADLVIVEGAGSPAEVNLRQGDIANMGFAEAADVPVVLVGDVERGGVIASIVGTHALLPEDERSRLKGVIINKFRGDPSLFDDALKVIEDRTGLASLGVIPWFPEARFLPKEDSLSLATGPISTGSIRIAVPRFPRIANFDDLDPLDGEPDVSVVVVPPGDPLPGDADAVVLAGSKATIADLAVMAAVGWDGDLAAHRRRGGLVVGLCGGYQMLGKRVADPDGVEGPRRDVPGLGHLDVATVLSGDKTLRNTRGVEAASGEAVRGYEIHMGETAGPGRRRPWLKLDDGRLEGAISEDGRVMGCYLHGIFAADSFRRAFLGRLRQSRPAGVEYETRVEETLDALAAHLERSLDFDRLLAITSRR